MNIKVTLTDITNGEKHEFIGYNGAIKLIYDTTGIKYGASQILKKSRTKKGKSLLGNRYIPEVVHDKYREKSRRRNLMACDGWEFVSYSFSPSVIVGEKRIGWYDEEKLQDLKYRLRKAGCFFCYNEAADNESRYSKHGTRVEVYMKVDKDLTLKEKVSQLKGLIDAYGIG